MKKGRTNIHRGQLLEDAVKASGLKKEKVAIKAGYQRTSYYKHIKEPDLAYHILTAYGRAIRYDFTEVLPEMPKYMIQEPEDTYELTPEESRKQIDYWRNKYIDLMERYTQLVIETSNK